MPSHPHGLQVRLEVRGMRGVTAALDRIGQSARTALRTAGSVGAGIVEEEVHKRVPVLTGLLDRSMQSAVGVEPDMIRIWIGPREDMEVPGYGDPAEYGEIIEAKGSPAGRGKAFMKQSAQAAAQPVVTAVVAILRAAVTGNVFMGKPG